MLVKRKDKSPIPKKQKKLSPEEQISQRYGLHKQGDKEERKARSINELYSLRYKNLR